MLDWRGTPIEVGSHVVYAVTQSSSVTMVEGVVEEIGEEPWNKWSTTDTRVKPVLFVTRLGEHYGRSWRKVGQRVKLTAVQRVTVVSHA